MFKLFYSYLIDPALLCRGSKDREVLAGSQHRGLKSLPREAGWGLSSAWKPPGCHPSWLPQCTLHSLMSSSLLPEFTGSSLTALKPLPKAFPDPTVGVLSVLHRIAPSCLGASQNHPQAGPTLGPRTLCHLSLYIQQHRTGALCSVHADWTDTWIPQWQPNAY